MKIADRVADLPPYVFAKLGRRIQELTADGRDIIRLDIGSPDLPPPDFVIEAMERSMREPSKHGYGGYYGTPQLRRRWRITMNGALASSWTLALRCAPSSAPRRALPT